MFFFSIFSLFFSVTAGSYFVSFLLTPFISPGSIYANLFIQILTFIFLELLYLFSLYFNHKTLEKWLVRGMLILLPIPIIIVLVAAFSGVPIL